MDLSDFSDIARFLGNFAPEVSGRAAPLSPELRERIAQFARGELADQARQDVAAEVLANPDAVEALATAIREAA